VKKINVCEYGPWFLTNTILGYKSLRKTNTLAYFIEALMIYNDVLKAKYDSVPTHMINNDEYKAI
jgi:hypothetical protein